MSLKGKDIISALDITREDVERLNLLANTLKDEINKKGVLDYARNKIMTTVFIEPSTRTRLSFQFAMVRIGGTVVDFGLAEASSIKKGESFEDTMRMVDGYDPDVIVLRQSVPGNAALAAEICKAPVINAGDGWNEHPTQALLDIYTIWRELGRIDGLKIGIMGDLKYGRTPSSLSYLLSKFKDITMYYIAPKQLQIRDEVLKRIGNMNYVQVERPEEVIEELDTLYVTRLQKERFEDPSEYERLKGSFNINRAFLEKFKKIPIIMHPFPRVFELSTDVDNLPQAKYFEQAKNGMYMRAALIKEILGI